MDVIIYGSRYGTARQYAEELARRTGADVFPYDEVDDADRYETIVYIGSLYAGGVLGMKKTFAKLGDCCGKRIVIATVGLADPENQENVDNIEGGMRAQLSDEVYRAARAFHLRGGIDYSRLGIKHKAMMALLHKKAQGLPEEKQTAEVRAMIETYGKRVSFVDFGSLDKIVAYLQAGAQ